MPDFVHLDPSIADESASTRDAPLKWVVVVDRALDPGRAANAVACVSARIGAEVTGLLGRGAVDPAGREHPGLPWIGCTVLGADAERLTELRDRVLGAEGLVAADMPEAAQRERVYADYRAAVEAGEGLAPLAVTVVGPRNRVDRLVKRLDLLT